MAFPKIVLSAIFGGLAAAFIVATFSLPAQAALITRTFDLNASNFTADNPADSVPVDPLIGSFTVTFDPALVYTNQTTGIVLNSLNIPLGSAISFSAGGGGMTIGGSLHGANGLQSGTADFDFSMIQIATSPIFSSADYAVTGVRSSFHATAGFVTLGTSAVPESGTVAIFLAGIASLVFFRRNRNCASANA